MIERYHYLFGADITSELEKIYKADPHNHEAGDSLILLYILHKAGLIEDGINTMQFDYALEAYYAALNAMADLLERGIARD